MKKIFLLALITLFVGSLSIASCGSSNAGNDSSTAEVSKKDSPTDAAIKVLDLFKEKKYMEALLLCKDADKEPEEKLKQAAALIEIAYEMNGGLVSYEILGETISEDGQSANVDVNFIYGKTGGKKDNVVVEMTDKGWQVVVK